MGSAVNFKYAGSTPGADSNTYPLFSTITAGFGGDACATHGLKRLFVTVDNNNTGTFVLSRSNDRGTTWVVVDSQAAAASTSTSVSYYDAVILGFKDFKLEWTNGGSAQTGFTVTISLDDGRAATV